MSAASPLLALEVDAGDDEVGVDDPEAEVELGLEVELVLSETSPPWTVAGAVLVLVLPAVAA
jgi:hypothetical protein